MTDYNGIAFALGFLTVLGVWAVIFVIATKR